MSVRLCQHLQHKFFCKQPFRELHSTQVLHISPNQVTEVRIPVPWGHIAGKWWGNTNKQPILAIHGWQDNANTFDPLLELLPDSVSVLAIDSPGHGLSSHFQKGMFYHATDFVMACRRVQNHFKWDNMTIMGHSGGGGAAFKFASLYPESVKALISLDILKPLAPGNLNLPKLGERVDSNVSKVFRQLDENPKYTLEEIENRWLAGGVIKGSLSLSSIRILCKRAVQLDPESGKYFLTRDPRLKLQSLQIFDESHLLEMASNIKCHMLVIKCKGSKLVDLSLKNNPDFINTIKKSTKSFRIIEVEGTHHAHINNPERFAPIISDFIHSLDL